MHSTVPKQFQSLKTDGLNETIFVYSLLATTQGAVTPSFSVETSLRTGGTGGAAYSDGTVISVTDIGATIRWTLHVPCKISFRMPWKGFY